MNIGQDSDAENRTDNSTVSDNVYSARCFVSRNKQLFRLLD